MRRGVSLALVVLLVCTGRPEAAQITLVKHARRADSVPPDVYVVRPGDTLRRILLGVYRARQEDLTDLYRRFAELNPQISSLDDIRVGTRIRIPEKLVQERRSEAPRNGGPAFDVREVTTEEYVVKQGEYLSKILRDITGVPNDLVFAKYMDLVLRLNPTISDPDRILAGQRLRLPSARQVLEEVRGERVTPGGGRQGVTKTPDASTEEITKVPDASQAPRAAAGQGAGQERKGAQGQVTQQMNGDGKTDAGTSASAARRGTGPREAKERVLPALREMGGVQRDSGTYFVPVAGGTSLAVDTREIPVVELVTGKKIILDLEGRITPEIRHYIEKAFPSFAVVSGPAADMEGLVDKILDVSGFFSVNKDPAPLMVGSEEKVSVHGKWLVYKDFSRRNVFVVNLLDDGDVRLPQPIRSYVGSFGVDVVEIGGKQSPEPQVKPGATTNLNGSYRALLTALNIPHRNSQDIVLMDGGAVRIVYKAWIIAGRVIIAESLPDPDMASLLDARSYRVVDASSASVEEVLKALQVDFEGPPVRLTVARGRSELEVPAVRVGSTLVLTRKIDASIQRYLASQGMRVLVW